MPRKTKPTNPVRRLTHILLNRITLTGLLLLIEITWLFWGVWRLAQYALWINVAFSFITLIIVLHILRRDENPAYKTGWILMTCILPVFGWVVYAMFGNKHLSRRMRGKIEAVEKQHRALLTAPAPARADEIPDRLLATSRYIEKFGPYPAHDRTHARYYALGDDMFPDLLADLETAQHYIFLEYFIIAEGVMLDRIMEILRCKAAAGVDVRILYDDVGCEAASLYQFAKRAERDGIRCLAFNPIVPVISIVVNHRDHRKFTIVDGRVAYTGGLNIADEYINQTVRFGHWKDTGLRLEGSAVWNFTVMFLNLWNAFRPTETDYTPFRADRLPETAAGDPLLVQPYSDSPLDDEHVGENIYLEILAQAKDYVWIFTPYLIIDSEMQTALCTAAKRGVDVRIVTPGIPDKKTAYRLTRSYYPPLLRAGVKIYEYTPGFIHAKNFLCDDSIATIGTINMDYRSLYLHFECGTLLFGGDPIPAIRRDFEDTFEKSREIHLRTFRRSRGLIQSFIDAVLRALSPLF